MSFWDGAGHFISNAIDPASYIENGIRSGNWDPTSSQFGPAAPGGTVENGGVVDTSQADEDRARQMAIIAQLQQQAMNGDPVALDQLQKATQKTVAGQSALGQTSAAQRGTDPSTAMRNILGSQAHAQQVGVGQADILKALTQQQAQQQLAGIMGSVRQGDISQAAGQQAAGVGMNEANAAQAAQKDAEAQGVGKSMLSTIPVVGGALGKSDGGPVDGRARVPGDSEANDTVPAMLSPGEIVVPRSHAGSPEAAATFIEALFANKHAQHFAEGGGVQFGTPTHQEGTGHGFENATTDSGLTAGVERTANTFLRTEGLGPHQIVPYTPLETGPANDIRAQQAQLAADLVAQSKGAGPSAVGSQLQAGTDQNIQDAMAASARGQDVLGAAAAQQQKLGGESAMARAGEVSQAQRGAADVNAVARGQSQQQALIDQKAKLNTTLMNMGLDAAHRLAILNTIGAAGQGLAAAGASGIFAKNGTETTPEQLSSLSDNPFQEAPQGGESSPGDWNNPYDASGEPGRGSAGDISGGEGGFAHGGKVPCAPKRFADGGQVPGTVVILTDPEGRKFAASRKDLSPDFLSKYATGSAKPDAFDSIPRAPPGPAVEMPPAPIRRDPEWEAQMAAMWARRQADLVEQTAPPPMRADRAPAAPRPQSIAPRAAESAYVTLYDRQGRPLRVARSGVSSAFLQRFAEGGPVLPPGDQDALTAYVMRNPSALMSMAPAPQLASFQPAPQPMRLGSTVGSLEAPRPAMPWPIGSREAALAQARPSPGLAAKVAAENSAKYDAWLESPEGRANAKLKAARESGEYTGVTTEDQRLGSRDYGASREVGPLAVTHRTPPTAPEAPPARAPGGQARGASGAAPPVAPPDANATKFAAETENEQGAIRAQGEAESERNRQLAEDARTRQAEALAQLAREEKMNADYQGHRQAAQDKFESLTQKYADATIDPSRFWGTRTTGDKILAGIGLALGALGGSADGVNRSVGIINQAIDRDIEAQKENISRAGEVAGRQGQLLGIMRANFGDDAQALAATRATMAANAQARIAQLEAQTADPIKKAQLSQMSAQVGARAAGEAQKAAAQREQNARMFALEQGRLGMEGKRLDLAAGRLGAKGASAADIPEVQDARSRYIASGGIGGETAEIELATALAKASGGGKSTPKLVKMFRDQLSAGAHTLTAGQRATRADAVLRGLSVPGIITGDGAEGGAE